LNISSKTLDFINHLEIIILIYSKLVLRPNGDDTNFVHILNWIKGELGIFQIYFRKIPLSSTKFFFGGFGSFYSLGCREI